jgi:steroid delta-isomerase-like uncharacterized protein
MQGLEPFPPRNDKVSGWERCSAPDGRAKSEHALLLGRVSLAPVGGSAMANVIEIAKAAVTAYNNKDWNELRNLLAADTVYDEKATNRRLEGLGQIIEALQGWAQAFPDSKGTFIREFASNDTAILEIVWKGVHTGPLQTPTGAIPASNKPIEVPACEFFRVEGGKVSGMTHYFDMLTLLNQIGVTGAAAPAKSAA